MMKRIFLSIAVVTGVVYGAMAVPASPKLLSVMQPDGAVVEAYLRGDENFHFYETLDGSVALADESGYLCYAEISADGLLSPGCHRIIGSDFPVDKLNVGDLKPYRSLFSAPQRVSPGAITPAFPTIGKVRGLIILAEYDDVKMTGLSTHEHYDKMLNAENYSEGPIVGSVRDYFMDQSAGRFVPEFDVVGPVTLPKERIFYGINDDRESYSAQMRDACTVADRDFDVDFTRYDADGDGVVDFVFIIYAGHGEAQGGGVETVWPAMMDFTDYVTERFDGMRLGVGACSSELSGAADDEPALDGIGTICHEFSHILGLPDIYDPTYAQGYGMGHYDMMDRGEYNGDSFVPSGYTAMDRYYVGWLEPRVLDASQNGVSLKPLSQGGDAIFIVNPGNENEYYTLENRQWSGWDEQIPGHGLVITRVTYDPSLWKRNIVNSPRMSNKYEHVKIMAADNVWLLNSSVDLRGSGNEAGDVFPGTKGKTTFSGETVPRACWMSTEDTDCGFSIDNICELSDGTVTFDFSLDMSGTADMRCDETLRYDRARNMLISDSAVDVYTITGIHKASYAQGNHALSLGNGIYVAIGDERSIKFVISK